MIEAVLITELYTWSAKWGPAEWLAEAAEITHPERQKEAHKDALVAHGQFCEIVDFLKNPTPAGAERVDEILNPLERTRLSTELGRSFLYDEVMKIVRNYWRSSPYGLTDLLKEAGYADIAHAVSSGDIQAVQRHIDDLPRWSFIRRYATAWATLQDVGEYEDEAMVLLQSPWLYEPDGN